jgi:casein kinase II subunit alpha
MHRDIKPLNILIHPEHKSLKIIDFGLSEYYIPGQENSEHVASLYYKAPELLFSNPWYDYRVDIWAAGMVMGSMVHGSLL